MSEAKTKFKVDIAGEALASSLCFIIFVPLLRGKTVAGALSAVSDRLLVFLMCCSHAAAQVGDLAALKGVSGQSGGCRCAPSVRCFD